MADTRPARLFGITTTLSGLGDGIIANSLTFNDTVETARAQDEKGKVLDIAAFTASKEVTIDGLFTATGVNAGDQITLGDRDYLIASVNKTESNTDFQRASVTAQGADVDTVIHPLSAVQA